MPGRAGGQLVLFQKHAVGPAGLGQMVERGDADRAAADDDHARRRRKLRHSVLPQFTFEPAPQPSPVIRYSSIDRRRNHPDDDRRLAARDFASGTACRRSGSCRPRRGGARRRRSRCRTRRTRHSRLPRSAASPRSSAPRRARRSERSISKLPPRSGDRSSSTRPVSLVPSVRRRPARTITPRSALVGHVMAEEQADRHAEQLGEGAQIAERRRRQAALDLADPADRAAELQRDLRQASARAPCAARECRGQQRVAPVPDDCSAVAARAICVDS